MLEDVAIIERNVKVLNRYLIDMHKLNIYLRCRDNSVVTRFNYDKTSNILTQTTVSKGFDISKVDIETVRSVIPNLFKKLNWFVKQGILIKESSGNTVTSIGVLPLNMSTVYIKEFVGTSILSNNKYDMYIFDTPNAVRDCVDVDNDWFTHSNKGNVYTESNSVTDGSSKSDIQYKKNDNKRCNTSIVGGFKNLLNSRRIAYDPKTDDIDWRISDYRNKYDVFTGKPIEDDTSDSNSELGAGDILGGIASCFTNFSVCKGVLPKGYMVKRLENIRNIVELILTDKDSKAYKDSIEILDDFCNNNPLETEVTVNVAKFYLKVLKSGLMDVHYNIKYRLNHIDLSIEDTGIKHNLNSSDIVVLEINRIIKDISNILGIEVQ